MVGKDAILELHIRFWFFLIITYILVCTVNSAVQYENANGYWLINFCLVYCFCLLMFLFVWVLFVVFWFVFFLLVIWPKKDIWFITSLCKLCVPIIIKSTSYIAKSMFYVLIIHDSSHLWSRICCLLYAVGIHVLLCIGPWSWSYDSCIYKYLCNQCLSPLKLWVRSLLVTRCTRYNTML
jgi:hypothetical protein